ncbi:hypothetical protein [Pseudomonas gingeri]
MPLAKPNQQLRHDLKEAAALLKWSGIDLIQAAMRLSEAGQEGEAKELLKIAADFQEAEDKLADYADEVKAGRIVRGRSE